MKNFAGAAISIGVYQTLNSLYPLPNHWVMGPLMVLLGFALMIVAHIRWNEYGD